MAVQDIIVIGTSAGGVEALRALTRAMPRDLPAAVFAVLHIGQSVSVLPEILTASGALPAIHPETDRRLSTARFTSHRQTTISLLKMTTYTLAKGRRKIVAARQLTRCSVQLHLPTGHV